MKCSLHEDGDLPMQLFRGAGALLIFLEVTVAMRLPFVTFLPLGGSHIAQIAILMGTAFVLNEFRDIFGG